MGLGDTSPMSQSPGSPTQIIFWYAITQLSAEYQSLPFPSLTLSLRLAPLASTPLTKSPTSSLSFPSSHSICASQQAVSSLTPYMSLSLSPFSSTLLGQRQSSTGANPSRPSGPIGTKNNVRITTSGIPCC